MHIAEGVLSAPVLAIGGALAAGGVGIGLRKTEYEKIPEVAVLSSAFFVASLIHVPLGPTSVHLILNGLIGLLLGWSAMPAILVGLALQAILFQFGGITTLGVNTVNMALPAVLCFYLFRSFITSDKRAVVLVAAFFCGAVGVFVAGLLVACSLFFTGESFLQMARMVVLAHLPIMAIEGILTSFCVAFLRKVRPEILGVNK
ncbi:MAG: cobalt transporter CbiM [Deltaproteobacteria bacterium]|nr:MAG: cobalt transporter CbiM [Deltaproteobacteria bacterium]